MNVRKALDDSRVFSRAPMVEGTARQYRQALAEHIEQPFRELLAYLDQQHPGDGFSLTSSEAAYRDAADRLRFLLDNE